MSTFDSFSRIVTWAMRRSRESHRHFRSHLVQLHWPANEAAKSARVADLAQPRASLVNTQSMIVGFKFEFRRAARSQRRTNSSGPTEALITRAVCVAAPEAEVETEASRVFIIAGPLFRSIGLIYRLLARTLETTANSIQVRKQVLGTTRRRVE